MRCQFMHSERDIYGDQSYQTVLRENTRLAKAKMAKVEVDVDASAQVYINVFSSTKSRLSCFANIAAEDDFDFKPEPIADTGADFLS